MNTWLVLAAIAAAACSGAPLLWRRRGDGARGRQFASALQVLAALLAGTAALRTLLGGRDPDVQLALSPLLPALSFGLDALAAVFVLPVCVLCACAAVYDLGYWRDGAHVGRQVPAFAGLLFAALLGIPLARDGVAFLMAWEVMALAAFFLVATEHHRRDVRAASWIYLAATHAGTLLLVAFFCCWQAATGSLALEPSPAGAIAPAGRDLLFLLALLGFGMKAGVVPLHFWLPPAHAAAPSHVSAVMSGVLIKTGVYGVARCCWLLPDPPLWWGQLLLGLGALSAVVGVAFAIGQHDLKRLLAYHSIENIGIIFLGLGLLLLGRATGQRELIVLGLGGALLHTWNHGLFKGLLFLAAGATIQRTGTRDIDRLGGVAARMPWTAAAFLCGAVAISGLPPLNGFVSELLTYLGLFGALRGDAGVAAAGAAAIPALALTSAMALLCFVKVFGVVYLGTPRSDGAAAAREAGRALRWPMAVLALGCALIGLLPLAAAPPLQAAIDDWLPAGATARLRAAAPLGALSALGPLLALAALAALVALRRRPAARGVTGTWDCGYVRPTAAMQYTAASFAQLFVDCTRRLLLPRTQRLSPSGLFPRSSHFHTYVPDLLLDRLLLPGLSLLAAVCNRLHLLHRGHVQVYLLYVLLTLLVLLMLV